MGILDVDAMLETMPLQRLQEWRVYFGLEPFGPALTETYQEHQKQRRKNEPDDAAAAAIIEAALMSATTKGPERWLERKT